MHFQFLAPISALRLAKAKKSVGYWTVIKKQKITEGKKGLLHLRFV